MLSLICTTLSLGVYQYQAVFPGSSLNSLGSYHGYEMSVTLQLTDTVSTHTQHGNTRVPGGLCRELRETARSLRKMCCYVGQFMNIVVV